MPNATSGNVVSSSAQVGADVILTGNIKNGEIINADISAAAAIVATKLQELNVGANGGVIPSTGVENGHVKAAAGIVDTKLATIATAGKVDGAALTLFANIPAGAGAIPLANLSNATSKVYVLHTNVTIANPGNGVESTIFTVSVPANTLSTNNALIGRIWITAEAWTTGSTNSYKLKYGNTTLATATIGGATENLGYIDFAIVAAGATNAQEGFIVNSNSMAGLSSGTSAIDSTAAANLVVTMTPSASNPGDSLTYGAVHVTKAV